MDRISGDALTLAPNTDAPTPFRMVIERAAPDDTGTLFHIHVGRFAPAVVSYLRFDVGCTQGLVVCGVHYHGVNRFNPVFISLDARGRQTRSICDIRTVVLYPASADLMRFDWTQNEYGLRYLTPDRIPPDFTPYEDWIVTDRPSSCEPGD